MIPEAGYSFVDAAGRDEVAGHDDEGFIETVYKSGAYGRK